MMAVLTRRRTLFSLLILLLSAVSKGVLSDASSNQRRKRPTLSPGSVSKTVSNHRQHDLVTDTASSPTVCTPRGGESNSEDRKRQITVILVATALFNDMLQLTMLVPIIHTLVTSPPPLGVLQNHEIALGVFFAAKDICQLTFAPLGGILIAKTSPNVALALSTSFLGLATIVFAEATTYRQLLLARGAQGAASAAVLSGGLSLISETHPSNIRGAAIGKAYSGLAAGLLCGPLIGGLLFDKLGRKGTFRLAAAVVLTNALAQTLLMKFAPAKKVNIDTKETKTSPTAASIAQSSRALLRNGNVMTVAASTFAIHTVVGVIKPLSQVVLDRDFGLGMVQRSLVITIATLTYFVSTPIAGRLSDHMQRSSLVALSLLLMGMSTIFFALRTVFGLAALHVSVALLGASLGIHGAAGQSLLADLVDRHRLGKYSMAFALSDMADSLGAISGPIVGLSVSQVFGQSAGPALMGCLCLILSPLVHKIQV